MTRFAKFWTAATGGLLTWLATVTTSAAPHITSSEWVAAVGMTVTALGVWFVPNG